MLFLDFSSAFNTINSYYPVCKLGLLGFGIPLCNWLLDFFTEIIVPQHHYPQYGLSPGLCTEPSAARSDTTVVGLTRDDYNLAYWELQWSQQPDDEHWQDQRNSHQKSERSPIRKIRPSHAAFLINNTAVEMVSSTMFCRGHISPQLVSEHCGCG